MFTTLPASTQEFMNWGWARVAPYFDDLDVRPLTAETADGWLRDWSRITALISETRERLYVATTLDTADEIAEHRFHEYLEDVMEPFETASQRLREKFLYSELEPEGFTVPLRSMRAQADLYREDNLPLLTQEQKVSHEYQRIIGAQTVEWDGQEKTLEQVRPVFMQPNRPLRERAWRLISERQLQDRGAINDVWTRFMTLRGQIADNADMADFRAYRWRELQRFDYTPDDCLRFHDAIEEVAVPAAARLYEKRRQRLGYDTLRPWDLSVDPEGRAPLTPYDHVYELLEKSGAIFRQVDPTLGEYFDVMRREQLLDLENRKGKAPGGYCTEFAHVVRPYIFMNAVKIHDDVQTLLHEGGHAFHVFESAGLPYLQQRSGDSIPTEFCEVASMSMELLAAPYLAGEGAFYSERDAARARVEHLEGIITFWPYMAVVDAFQHWVYTNHKAASDPANCDAKWSELWDRFMKGIDWNGLDDAKATGWHRKLHIFELPFYYVEYGLAQLGAVQVWANSLDDATDAVARYRKALALGNTATLPDLFSAAGAKFQPDAATLRQCVELVERTIEQLDPV